MTAPTTAAELRARHVAALDEHGHSHGEGRVAEGLRNMEVRSGDTAMSDKPAVGDVQVFTDTGWVPLPIFAGADHLAAFVRQAERDRKDAERYRWLRDQHDSPCSEWNVRRVNEFVIPAGCLDAAIDAAIQPADQTKGGERE